MEQTKKHSTLDGKLQSKTPSAAHQTKAEALPTTTQAESDRRAEEIKYSKYTEEEKERLRRGQPLESNSEYAARRERETAIAQQR